MIATYLARVGVGTPLDRAIRGVADLSAHTSERRIDVEEKFWFGQTETLGCNLSPTAGRTKAYEAVFSEFTGQQHRA